MSQNKSLFLRHLAQTSASPLLVEITAASGCWLYAPKGKQYLDLISGIAVSNVGHSNPQVVQAVCHQAAAFMHVMVYGELVQSPQVQYAQWLAHHLPNGLDSIYFVNSGSEAIEGAIKLAKRVTGRTQTVSFHLAYHGATQGALSLGGNEERRSAFLPLVPGNNYIRYNHIKDLSVINQHTAAVVIEPIQAEAGVVEPSTEFLQEVQAACRKSGALLIVDECQTGFGRTGPLFASAAMGIQADILVMGKALGGGMPLGAFAAAKHRMDALTEQPVLGHITTFGGHPVCCAAGLAAAKCLTPECLAEVTRKEKLFKACLHHPAIREVRGRGLLLAVEWPSADFNKALIARLIERGMLTDWFLFNDAAMRIAPPLIISDEQIRWACNLILEEANAIYNS